MISEFIITDPERTLVEWWPAVYPHKRVFQFKTGLNIIWAPNGFGKSTLLQCLARYTHCAQGGVPRITQASLAQFSDGPERYLDGMSLVSDGQPVHLLDPTDRPGMIGGMAGFDYDFSDAMHLTMGGDSVSSGERLSHLTDRVLRSLTTLDEPEDLCGKHEHNEERRRAALQCFEAKIKLGPRTLLLDEPDRSRDLPSQFEMWRVYAQQTKFQIIAATHSPFALSLPGANYIDLKEGYLKESLDTLALWRLLMGGTGK